MTSNPWVGLEGKKDRILAFKFSKSPYFVNYLVGLAFIPKHWTPGFSRSPYFDNHLSKKPLYLHHRYHVGLFFIPQHQTPGSMPGDRG